MPVGTWDERPDNWVQLWQINQDFADDDDAATKPFIEIATCSIPGDVTDLQSVV